MSNVKPLIVFLIFMMLLFFSARSFFVVHEMSANYEEQGMNQINSEICKHDATYSEQMACGFLNKRQRGYL
jgi:hypothetical protein